MCAIDKKEKISKLKEEIKKLRNVREEWRWEIIRGQREYLDWHELKRLKKQERKLKKELNYLKKQRKGYECL